MKLILQAIKSIFSKFENRASALDATCKELRNDLDSFKKGAIPFFDLVEMGLPEFDDGETASMWANDETMNRIFEALENGPVRFRVKKKDSVAFTGLICATNWDKETYGNRYFGSFIYFNGSARLIVYYLEFESNSIRATCKRMALFDATTS